MSSAPSFPGVEVGLSWLGGCEHVLTVLVGFCGVEDAAGTVSDIIAARIQPAAAEMMDALAPARRSWPRRWRAGRASDAGLAQHPDGRFDPVAPSTKEYVHARRLPAGL
jgi:hypothetical protein